MIREIALVTENPGTHRELIEHLRATGLQVRLLRNLPEALPLFADPALSMAGLILDSPRHYDSDLLAQLAFESPQLPQLLFDLRQLSLGESEGWARPHTLHSFDQALTDADSFRLIHSTLGRALGHAMEEVIQPQPDTVEPAPATNGKQANGRQKYAFLH